MDVFRTKTVIYITGKGNDAWVMQHDSRLGHPVEMISLDIQVCDFYEF